MPRKKTRRLNIRDMACYGIIAEELARHPELADFVIEDAVITLQERVTPTINEVDKIIDRIRFCHATHKYRYPVFMGRELIDQKTLAKMAGVSRQTVSRWEELGLVSRSDIGIPHEKYFVIKEVISQLEKLRYVK